MARNEENAEGGSDHYGDQADGVTTEKTSQKAPTPWGARDLQDLRRRTCDTFVKRVKVDLPGVKYGRKYISHDASEHPLIRT